MSLSYLRSSTAWLGLIAVAAGCGGNAVTDLGGSRSGPAGQDGATADDASSPAAGGGSTQRGDGDGSASSSGSGSSSSSSSSGSAANGGSAQDAGRAAGDAGRGRDAGAGVADAAVVDAGVGSSDSGDPIAAARAQCLAMINADRATLNPPSPPLTEATAQEACVDGQAMADEVANVAHSAFGQCKESAQDECPAYRGPPSAVMTLCLTQMWAEGPPMAGQDNHWLNMSNPKYKRVACGFYQIPGTNTWWATQDFF